MSVDKPNIEQRTGTVKEASASAHERSRVEPAGSVVLVADHNPTQAALARTLARVVMGKSTSILKAESGPEVVELARRERPQLLLLDFGLPKLDAAEVLRQLRSAGVTVAVVVFAERMDADFVRGKLPAGAGNSDTMPQHRVFGKSA